MMKTLITLFIFLMAITCFAQGKWRYASNFKELPADSIGQGSINDVLNYTGLKYLSLDLKNRSDGCTILYLPITHKPILIYASTIEKSKIDLNAFNNDIYDLGSFNSDFKNLKDNFHANEAYISYILGEPKLITDEDLYFKGKTHYYINKSFAVLLHFEDGSLKGYTLYKRNGKKPLTTVLN